MERRSDRFRRSHDHASRHTNITPVPVLVLVLVLVQVLVLLFPLITSAQENTAAIRGLVTEAGTGAPLANVNLLLLTADGDTTRMGAVTGSDGRYRILFVPPGTYLLQAGMMGYRTLRVREFVVGTDRSYEQDFHLEPIVLESGHVVTVTAPLDVLRRDVTSSRDALTTQQMMDLPVLSTTDILALQTTFYVEQGFLNDIPGYYDRGLQQLHVRGGRNAEVAFMIDGLQVTNLVFGGQAMKTNPTAQEEMVVMASGMSAEYGNALSGVVNFVTRTGGPRYEGNLEILSSELSGAACDDARDMTTGRGFLGGPVSGVPGLTFFLSGSATTARDFLVHKDDIVYDLEVDPRDPSSRRPDIEYDAMPDDWRAFDPAVHDPYRQRETSTGYGWRIYPADIFSGWIGYGINTEWDLLVNLSQQLGRTMRLKLSLLRNGCSRIPYTDQWRYSMLWGLPGEVQRNCLWGTERWDAEAVDPWSGDPKYRTQAERIIPSTGLTDFANEKNRLETDHARLAAVWTHQPGPNTYYTLRFSYLDYARTMRVKRWVNEDGWTPRFEHLYQDSTWAFGDAMHQVTLSPVPYTAGDDHDREFGYFPIGGAGFGSDGSDRYYSDQFDITRHVRLDATSRIGSHHMVKGGLEYKSLTLRQLDYQLLYLTPPYIVDYRRTPTEFSLYLQDRIEYRHFVLNLGLRWDEGNSGDLPFWLHPMNPMDQEGNLVIDPSDPETAPMKWAGRRRVLSPRLGLAIPISEASVFYANYGLFYQYPVYRNLYLQGTLEDSVPLMGNPDLQMEFAAKYEFGYRRHLDDLHVLHIVAWGKDQSNLVGTMRVPAFFGGVENPYDYTVFMNMDYAVSRGVDVSLARRLSGLWSGRIAYSWLTSEMNHEDPWAGYRGGDELDTAPKRRRPTGWDRPHSISAVLSLVLPAGFGPLIAGVRPFERAGVNLVGRASSGRPYTPTTKLATLAANSGRMPWKAEWDLRAWRDLRLLGIDLGLLVNIRNLFNQKVVQMVYSPTGSPTDPGPGATSYSENYDRSHYFGMPRLIDIGVRIRF